MFNNGVTEEAWTSDRAPMRPPYDQLPADWKMSIIDVDAGHRPQKGVDATRYQEVPVTTS